MSYFAKVFNVMIASPTDVAAERKIIRDVIYEWNAVNSESKRIVLMPVGWESHSSPEMGESPQEIINKQVLDRCDLLVGVFWTRLGTPTTEYVSGTIEEIERHILASKPAMLYFSSKSVELGLVDLEQFQELSDFKESCRNRGLYENYNSHADFKEKFYRHLQLKLNECSLFKDINLENSVKPAEPETRLSELGEEARILLKEASLDSHGQILYVRSMSGTTIRANDKNLIPSTDRREVAKWEAALDELKNKALLIERGRNGEVFEVSNLGYQVAEMVGV